MFFLLPQKQIPDFEKKNFLAARKTAGNVFLAAPKTKSWLPEKHFPGCQKSIYWAAPIINSWLPEKNFPGCPKNKW
jgi:hypothetical protein